MYQIGVISDTHGLLRPEIKEHLKTCGAILHAGDIDRPEILEDLRAIAPIYAVRGNVDGEWADALPRSLKLELFGLRIFLIHNKGQMDEDMPVSHGSGTGKPERLNERKMVESECNAPACDIVIYGHSHKYEEHFTGREKGLLWLNPGSCGPRRFTLPVTMALIKTDGYGDYQVCKVTLFQAGNRNREGRFGSEGQKGIGVDRNSHQNMPYGEDSIDLITVPVVNAIIRDINAGKSISVIAKKNKLSPDLTEFICRLYLTHPGVDVNGILDRMNIRNR